MPLVLLMRCRGTIDWWGPEFVDRLAADRDVILFDNVGIGYTDGEPRGTAERFADGAIEFVEALGQGQLAAVGRLLAVEWDVMIPAVASYKAVELFLGK
ncbi:alpha/beta fold hydrolase [Amycolatopsis lexingtonensis]|uniref:alpha/beta fold hydrolase n=1 Tax=Amycolatopsis lexingtonensis TaxID=218822 RepID=UPI003F6E71D1